MPPPSPATPAPGELPLLRIVTCGSVDDGKSTLIGRLLYESKGIYEDQLAAVRGASARFDTTGTGLDLALVTDGLKAEREQGITIDVAYRYFSTPRRKFIIADSPGHEQYTRNMATGASTADVAILLVDARHGVITQTRRHAYIVSLLGIGDVVLAVNKMDLVGWDRGRFEAIVSDFREVNRTTGIPRVRAIPMSALGGDHVTSRSAHAPWYDGPTLLEHLETLDPDAGGGGPMRLPVQLVSRPDSTFRGYMGTLGSGTVRPGDAVVVLPAGVRTTVHSVHDPDGPVVLASSPRAVTVTLADQVDATRGDVIACVESPPAVARRVRAHLVWFSHEPLDLGTTYRLKLATRQTNAAVTRIEHRVDVNTLGHVPAATLSMNDVASCVVEFARPVAVETYGDDRVLGAFVLIDRVTGDTAAAGMVSEVLVEASAGGVGPVSEAERVARFRQKPAVVRVSGDGAAVTAATLERLLFDAGHLAVVAPDAGASAEAILEAGLIVLTTGKVTGGQKVPVVDLAADTQRDALLPRLREAGVLSPPTEDFVI